MDFKLRNVPSEDANANPIRKILKTEKVFMVEMNAG